MGSDPPVSPGSAPWPGDPRSPTRSYRPDRSDRPPKTARGIRRAVSPGSPGSLRGEPTRGLRDARIARIARRRAPTRGLRDARIARIARRRDPTRGLGLARIARIAPFTPAFTPTSTNFKRAGFCAPSRPARSRSSGPRSWTHCIARIARVRTRVRSRRTTCGFGRAVSLGSRRAKARGGEAGSRTRSTRSGRPRGGTWQSQKLDWRLWARCLARIALLASCAETKRATFRLRLARIAGNLDSIRRGAATLRLQPRAKPAGSIDRSLQHGGGRT